MHITLYHITPLLTTVVPNGQCGRNPPLLPVGVRSWWWSGEIGEGNKEQVAEVSCCNASWGARMPAVELGDQLL